jgi:hypothetical protein
MGYEYVYDGSISVVSPLQMGAFYSMKKTDTQPGIKPHKKREHARLKSDLVFEMA